MKIFHGGFMIVHIFPDGFVPLPIYFVSVSSHHAQEAVNRSAGFYDISQLLIVVDGEGVLHCDGKDFPLRRGCAFYLDAHVPHAYESIDGLVTAWVTYRGSGCEDLRAYIGKKSFAYYGQVDVKKYVAQIETMEREYFDRRREGKLSSLLYSLLISFFDDRLTCTVSDMERVLRYMEAHFDQKLTVSELAAEIHCSKSAFCKNFKAAFGCTAFEKLLEIRLLNARSMLRLNPEDKVHLVAKRCGFDDVSYFCKAYKKRFAMTPASDR